METVQEGYIAFTAMVIVGLAMLLILVASIDSRLMRIAAALEHMDKFE